MTNRYGIDLETPNQSGGINSHGMIVFQQDGEWFLGLDEVDLAWEEIVGAYFNDAEDIPVSCAGEGTARLLRILDQVVPTWTAADLDEYQREAEEHHDDDVMASWEDFHLYLINRG